ncbi:MAG: hypothetical protein ACJAUL_000454 [Paraglaciecola sp.]|jgi:hypothetical protein
MTNIPLTELFNWITPTGEVNDAGESAAGKSPFVAAVELNEEVHSVRMKLSVVKEFKSKLIAQLSQRHIKLQTIVISHSLACFRAITSEDKHHFRGVTGGHLNMLEHPAFKWVNTVIGNLKNSLRGSCHSIGVKHLPRHLTEYYYLFINRFDLRVLLSRLAKIALQTPPMPYRLLRLADVYR